MKKVLSVLLSVLLICGTISVLFSLPATAGTGETVNLIVNGDGNGVGGKLVYTDDDVANSSFPGEILKDNAYGWYNNSSEWANVQVRYPHTFPENQRIFDNYSKNNVLSINNWSVALQAVELEPGKNYRMSIKAAVMPRELAPSNSGGSFWVYLDAKTGTVYGGAPTDKAWVVKHDITPVRLENGASSPVYAEGDFVEYSFVFSADEFASANGLSPNANGKYDARFNVENGSAYWLMFDDVVLQEVYDLTISAGEGGYVDKTSVALGENTTVKATAYYGNTFAGWYDNDDQLVSKQATYTGTMTKSLTAKFNVLNQIVDGNFESPNQAGVNYINTNSPIGNGRGNVLKDLPSGSDAALHGSKALYCKPTSVSTATQYIARYTVTVEKNKNYVFHYSYYDNEDPTQTSWMRFSAQAAKGNPGCWVQAGKPAWQAGAWKVESRTGYSTWPGFSRNASALFVLGQRTGWNDKDSYKNNWVDAWYYFNAGEDSTIFADGEDTAQINLMIGHGNSNDFGFYLDNVSFTEAVNTPNGAVSATAEVGGSVKANQKTPISVDRLSANGENDKYTDNVIAGTTAYSSVAVTEYTAVPDEGYAFAGWYDADGNCVSTDASTGLYTPGTYTAKFTATMGTTDAGYTVDNGDGTITAYPHYGNLFDAWYDSADNVISREVTIDANSNPGAVARFFKHNQIVNGGFEGDGNATISGSNCSSQVMTDTDGNKFVRLTGTAANNNFTAFSWKFNVQKGKKYLVSYKIREGIDADGNKLSTEDISFRKQIRPVNASGGYAWAGLHFASQNCYMLGNINNSLSENADLLPPSGTVVNITEASAGADNFGKYVKDATDWTTVSYVLDATTLFADSTDLFAGGNTAQLGIVLGINSAGTLVLDVDDIVVDEVKDEYTIGSNPTGGTFTVSASASTEALPVTYYAYPNSGYAFDGWYATDDTRVSMDEVYTPDTNAALTPKFVADALGFERVNGDETTAVPYYGNKFDGWYDGTRLVSTDKTIKKSELGDVTAKFLKGGNLLFDGGFEEGASTAAVYTAYPDYLSNNPTSLSVVPTCVPNSGPEFGDYCLQVVPGPDSAGKPKGLLNIPVDVRAGETYLWKFSYTFTSGVHQASTDYLTVSVDKANSAGAVTWTGNVVDYSIHVQKSSTEGLEKDSYAWGRIRYIRGSTTDFDAYMNLNGSKLSATNEWVDVYVMFKPETDGTHFLTLGCISTNSKTMVFDNMSLTAVETGLTPTTAVASGNGSVSSFRTDEPAYWSTMRRGESENIFDDGGVDTANPYYADMYVGYYAVPDLGYKFDGWYKGITRISSDKELVVKSTGDGEYTAKFVFDPDLYYATAELDANASTCGGYLTGETAYNELSNGTKVTFTAVPYRGNTFAGWYNKANGKLVSTSATYTLAVTENTTLVAKFNANNRFDDSGYENALNSNNIWGAGKEWFTASGSPSAAEASLSLAFAYDGSKSLNIYGPGTAIRHKAMPVEAGTNYHLSFMWLGSSATAKPTYVKVLNAADPTQVLAEISGTFAASADKNWQKAFVNFSTGTATSVIVEFKYDSTGASIYLDQLALYNTANAPFVVTADLKVEDGIYPGYLTCDDSTEVNFGENATVSVKGYERNEFLGWYENDVRVSTDLEYTFAADSFTDLVAVFKVNNIFPDSGAEHIEPGASLSHGKYTDWFVDEGNHNAWGFDVFVSNGNAYDGNAYYNALHRTMTYGTTIDNLKPNTNYVFSFWWTMPQDGSFTSVIIEGIQNETELARGMGNSNEMGVWQQVVVPFNSQQNTSIKLSFLYNAGSGNIFMDNFALYVSDFVGVFAADGGSVTSTVNGPADKGTHVVATATPDAGNTFKGWYNYKTSQLISTELTYEFTVNGPTYVIAYFDGPTAGEFNYFVDGDFENYCFDGVVFSHMFWETDWCNYSVVKGNGSTVTPKSGNLCLAIGSQSRNANIFVKNLKPNTDYTLSFWWNADPGVTLGEAKIFRYLEGSTGRLDQASQGAFHVTSYQLKYANADMFNNECLDGAFIDRDNGGTWQRVEMSFNPYNCTSVFLMLNMAVPGGGGRLYLDDVKVTAGSTQSDNTIGNGNFEDAGNVNGWEGSFTTATEGGNSFGVSSSSMYNKLRLDFAFDYPYTVTFKAKSAAAAKLAFGLTEAGELSLVDANGVRKTTTNTSFDTVTLTNEWKEYSLDVITTAFRSYRFYFESLDGGEFMVDDVKIEKVDHRVDLESLTFESDTNTVITAGTLTHGVAANNLQFFRISDTVAHSGFASLEMTANNLDPSSNAYLNHELGQNWSNLRVLSGRRYNLTFYAKADNAGDEFNLRVDGTDISWKTVSMISKTITLNNTEWTKISYDFSAINLVNNFGYIDIVVGNSDKKNTGSIYFDDLTVVETNTSAVGKADKLYTEDIAQNYFQNPSFEKADASISSYVKSGDAFYGNKYITVKAGDKIIIPVSTRYDYNSTNWFGDYTFAASIKGNSSARGYIGLSYSPDGSNPMTYADGSKAILSVNTNGKWARSGFTFTDYRWTNLYVVIECAAGTFDVDYLSMFNNLRAYKENPQLIDGGVSFGGYVDAAAFNKGNYIEGALTGLPEGSSVVLKGEKTYTSAIDAEGAYKITNIVSGTYKMYVCAGGCDFMTLYGDITFDEEGMSGLACERLSGETMSVTGEGVRNGIAKITDFDTGWSYFTATTSESTGQFEAYVISSENCALEGVTKVESVLQEAGMSVADFVPPTKSAAGGANQ